MKTKEEITAEIAQGVREATRQRAETEIVRESALRTELEKEARDSKKARLAFAILADKTLKP